MYIIIIAVIIRNREGRIAHAQLSRWVGCVEGDMDEGQSREVTVIGRLSVIVARGSLITGHVTLVYSAKDLQAHKKGGIYMNMRCIAWYTNTTHMQMCVTPQWSSDMEKTFTPPK